MNESCDQFLAGAGFPGDEDGAVCPGNLLRRTEGPPYRGALADDGILRKTENDFIPQIDIFFFELPLEVFDFRALRTGATPARRRRRMMRMRRL